MIFINDMPVLVHHIVKLFADDIKLLAVIKKDTDMFLLQEDIVALVLEWADEWRMRVNFKKCKAMHISNRSSPTVLHFPLHMNCITTGKSHVLENSRSEQDLGIQIQHNLKWNDQIGLAVSKANRTLRMLKKTFK